MAELPPSLQAELNNLQQLQRLTRKQRERKHILELAQQEYRSRIYPYETHPLGTKEPAPKYKPLLTYPDFNTRVNPLTDVLYKEKPLRDINSVMDWDWIVRNNPSVQAAFPKGSLETTGHYVKRVTRELQARKQNLDLLNQSIAYNPNPMSGFFAQRKADPKQRLYTTLDIETDDYGRPISISASRLQWDKKLHNFVAVDSLQRFYLAHNRDLLGTFDVHGMTSAKLLSLRDQQGAHYSTKYNKKEQQILQEYIGNSIIIGHNIVDFDLNRLFPDIDINNSTIDTLKLARSVWHGKENALHNVFYRLYGKKMEDMGLSHHDPNADTIASAMIAAKMFGAKGLVGASLRYIRESMDPAHIAEWDSMMDSMVTRGTFRSMYGRDLYEVFMSREEIIRDANGNPIGKKGELDDAGIHTYGELFDGDAQGNLQEAVEQIKTLGDALKTMQQQMGTLGKGVGHGIPALSNELAEAYNQYNNYRRMSLVKDISKAINVDEIDTLIKSSGIKLEGTEREDIIGWGTRLKNIRERDAQTKFEQAREHRLQRFKKYNLMSKDDEAAVRATKTYEELSDAIEDVTKKNQELMKVYHSIADIRVYDMNQYIAAAKKQWGGIMGASQGVVPNFLRNPVGRLGDAFFNAVDRSIAPFNAFNRAWNSGIGQAVTTVGGAIGGVPGMMIGGTISGLVSAGTQIAGNYKQAKAEMDMLNIQNNLNTLGAMVSWISTPFQLLHKAIKLVTGAFGGLTLKLNNIMGSGIGMMSQMGNPLEPLTGVNYVDYQRAGLVDMASLLKGGSTNTAIEGFAKMQRDLYRFGRVDTNKLLAANMLGVFDEAFTPTTDAEGSYYNMANKILHNMQGQSESQRADTMYYVTQLNDTLAQTIRSALMLGVSDVRQLSDPGDMYWRPLTTGEERGFRRTQREYGIATQQFGFSKMRFADRLWNVVGRDLYNDFNEIIDKLGEGNWRSALDGAISMWEDLKSRFSKIWEGDENGGGLKEKLGKGLDNAWDKIKEWGWKIANGIIDVWDQIFLAVLKKAQGLIAYLSTVQVGFEKDKKTGKWGISISSIGDVGKLDMHKALYEVTGSNSETGEVYTQLGANMSELDKLAEKYVPNYANKKALGIPVTPEDIAQGLMYASIGEGAGIDIEGYGLSGYKVHNHQEAIDLLQMLYEGGSGGTGYRRQASLWKAPAYIRSKADPSAYNLPIYDMAEKMIEEGQAVRNTIGQHYLGEKEEATLKLELFSEGEKKGSVKYAGGKVTYEGMSPLSSVGLGKGISVKVAQVQ